MGSEGKEKKSSSSRACCLFFFSLGPPTPAKSPELYPLASLFAWWPPPIIPFPSARRNRRPPPDLRPKQFCPPSGCLGRTSTAKTNKASSPPRSLIVCSLFYACRPVVDPSPPSLPPPSALRRPISPITPDRLNTLHTSVHCIPTYTTQPAHHYPRHRHPRLHHHALQHAPQIVVPA